MRKGFFEWETALIDFLLQHELKSGASALGLYLMSASYLSERAEKTPRRDLDVTLAEVAVSVAESEAELADIVADLVAVGLWAVSGDGYRLLGLNRWVRLPDYTVQGVRAKR